MLKEILDAIKRREETVVLGGVKLIVRELAQSSDLSGLQGSEDLSYRLVMLSTYTEDGALAFNEADLDAIKSGARSKLTPLFLAAARVNGMVVEDNVKNSDAVQS